MADMLSRRDALLGGAALTAAATVLPDDAQARQVHMEKALHHLQEAKRQLEMAARNKGGHRAKAHNLTHRAIEQVRAGMRYARG
jgi:hypothetical protein